MVDRDANWPSSSNAYSLDLVIGSGSFGLVWQATCTSGAHKNCKVAIKILDLETFPNNSITLIRKEIAIMSMSKHKNIVAEYISFVDLQYLWIVMPVIDAGSVLDIMRQVRPKSSPGIPDEVAIATILKETLEGLNYLHANG
jgi:serine/threonine-protein kinase OSR1/STK39